MFLQGEYGEVEAIDCEAINGRVVGSGAEGLLLTEKGRYAGIIADRLVPEDCPLRDTETARDVGQFATCLTCPHAIVHYSNSITEC